MKTAFLILFIAFSTLLISKWDSVPRETMDRNIKAAYAMGQQDLLVSIIDGEITWEVASR